MNIIYCLLFVTLLCIFSLCTPPSIEESSAENAISVNAYMEDTGSCTTPPNTFTETYLTYEDFDTGGFLTVEPGDALVFDLITPFDAIPSYYILFENAGNIVDMSGTGSPITANIAGNTIQGDFELSFVLNNSLSVSGIQRDLAIKMVPANGASGGIFGTSAPVGTLNVTQGCGDNPLTYDRTSVAVTIFEEMPSIRIVNCAVYDPRSCTGPTITDQNNSPGMCNATITVPGESDITLQETGNGVCPLIFTASESGVTTFPVGNNQIDYTFTNEFANNTISCSITFDVLDVEDPQITCPSALILSTSNTTCSAEGVVPTPSPITDNCNFTFSQTPFSGNASIPVGDHTMVSTAIDPSGNAATCTFDVNVIDLSPPVFPNCSLTPIRINTTDGVCIGSVNLTEEATPFDNCAVSSVSTNFPVTGNAFPLGNRTFFAQASDTNNLQGICTFTVSVIDNQPPTVTCPNDVSVISDTEFTTVFFAPPIVRDNCQSIVQETSTANSGDIFPLGTTLVIVTADDGTFQVSCNFTVTVQNVGISGSPSSTPIFLPSVSGTNSPSTTFIPPETFSRNAVPPSESRTPSRTENPSPPALQIQSSSPTVPPSRSPSRSTSLLAPSPSSSETETGIPSESKTRTPSRTNQGTIVSDSRTKSPFVQSFSSSKTPDNIILPYVQEGQNTRVILTLPCDNADCSDATVDYYLGIFAQFLEIPATNIHLEQVNGNIITFVVCDSPNVANLLNQIIFGTINGFGGVIVDDAEFNVDCPENILTESKSSKLVLSFSIYITIIILLVI